MKGCVWCGGGIDVGEDFGSNLSYSLSISPSYFPLYLMGLGNWSVDPGELSFSLSD